MLLYFHMTFVEWREHAVSLSTTGLQVFNFAPSPFIQNLDWFIFADRFQVETWLYTLGLLALLGLFLLFCHRSSAPALCILGILLVNKVYFYLCDFRLFANYHHFHLLYSLVFLISRDKLRFFRLALALSYFLSAIVKLSPSWMFGELFNTLPGKLPLLPKVEWVVTAACVAVILLELLGPICWFTRNRVLRRFSFVAFIAFHLYSGIIVGFNYTTLMLPLVVAAFIRFDEPLQHGLKLSLRNAATFALFGLTLLGGLWHYAIPGNVRLTSEGRYFGLFMFDANHPVQFDIKIRKGDTTWAILVQRLWRETPDDFLRPLSIRCAIFENGELAKSFHVHDPVYDGDTLIFNPDYFRDARLRIAGDPYLYFHYTRELIRRHQPDQVRIELVRRLDAVFESVRLVEIPNFDAAAPTYHPFKHNPWIQLPPPDAPYQYRWP